MAVTSEAKPINSNEELIGAMGGIDEYVLAGYLSDVECKADNLLIEINDENVTIPQTPAAALTPVQASTGNKMFSPLELPLRKKPCFWESTTVHLLKAAPPLCLEPDYSDAELD